MNKNKGFTIIEVVLVLAVAGLIFLVVFAAIPRLQSSRRDNQRKRDAEAILTLAIEYESARPDILRIAIAQQAFNSSTGAFWPYIENENFSDPSTGQQYVVVPNTGDLPDDPGEMWIGGTVVCGSAGDSLQSRGNSRDFTVLMKLERGFYCVDNPV